MIKKILKFDQIYQRTYKQAIKEIKKDDDVFKIAGIYMGIAMRLYRTSLSEEDFNKLKNTIIKIDVEPYKTKTFH